MTMTMDKRDSERPKGLPGGIVLPAVLWVSSMAAFAYTFSNPGLIDLGAHLSPAGIAVLLGVVTFAWTLYAIARRPPR